MERETRLGSFLPAANPGDPGLGVYALSQFAFCPRAGIITAEQADPEAENPPPIRRLDFQPQWSLLEIEYRLSELLRTGWRLLAAVIIASLLTGVMMLVWPILALFIGLAILLTLAWKLTRIAVELFTLSILRSEVINALPIEPVLPFEEPVPINWWQLMQAGFVSRTYLDKLIDDDTKLAGSPWRVLQRGKQRIPVCRVRSESKAIKKSHLVRIAAYCQLIELATGLESPYGIILWAGTFEGFAIPNSSVNRQIAREVLVTARRVIGQINEQTPSPPPQSLCARCRLGFPKMYRFRKTETVIGGSTLPAYLAYGEDGREYHSECGDRFCWIPPHERADEKHLQ